MLDSECQNSPQITQGRRGTVLLAQNPRSATKKEGSLGIKGRKSGYVWPTGKVWPPDYLGCGGWGAVMLIIIMVTARICWAPTMCLAVFVGELILWQSYKLDSRGSSIHSRFEQRVWFRPVLLINLPDRRWKLKCRSRNSGQRRSRCLLSCFCFPGIYF